MGGSVRDSILKRPCNDYDYAIETESYDAMKKYLLDKYKKIVHEDEKMFFIRVKTNAQTYADFTLCRKENTYSDGRHPDEVNGGTIFEDLARRDFTMNAMAIDENGNLIDLFNGVSDINNHLVRCVGSIERLWKDSLRLMRAVRFSITLRFELDQDILNCLNDEKFINRLDNIHIDRVRQELEKCLKADSKKFFKILGMYPLFGEYIFSKFSFRPVFLGDE